MCGHWTAHKNTRTHTLNSEVLLSKVSHSLSLILTHYFRSNNRLGNFVSWRNARFHTGSPCVPQPPQTQACLFTHCWHPLTWSQWNSSLCKQTQFHRRPNVKNEKRDTHTHIKEVYENLEEQTGKKETKTKVAAM